MKQRIIFKSLDKKGSILVEFAIGVPLLLACAIAMHDLPKYARMKSKMEFVAHEMVGILQNISQNRQNKKITLTDIKYAMRTAYLSIYPGVTMYATSQYHMPLGHFPHGFVYCVQGEDDGKVRMLWLVGFHTHGSGNSPNTVAAGQQTEQHNYSLIKYHAATNSVSPSSIYKDLNIRSGETKILLECSSYYADDTYWYFSDGRLCMNVSTREAFGFWMFPLKPSAATRGYFNTVVVFTPKPGLFSETPPS